MIDFLQPAKKFFSLITILLFLTSLAKGQDPIHDPSDIIQAEDGRYYLFSTGDGVYCMSATKTDFSDRRRETTPLDLNNYPSWIDSYVTGFEGNFWAPDIIYMNGYYYLYYSASSFGSSNSAIGVTRTASLSNPTWEDQGMVVYSSGGRSEINAIDPALIQDTDGRVWMSYGSWHGGIGIVEIDPDTGKAISEVTHLAGGNHQAFEAPYILKHDGYYYLFINRGTCCSGIASTYYVEVSRSTNITGPYSGTREFLTNQSGNVIGPGHVGYGENILSYHYYDGFSNGFPRLMTTTLDFVDGWPVAGPNGVDLATIDGTYTLIVTHSEKAIGMENAVAEDGTNIAQWSYAGDNSQKFIITPTEDQWHSIKPAINTDKGLDVYEISTENGANINLWDYWGGDGQQFCFMETSPGRYRIINKNSNRCVDIENASQADGANVIQWDCFENAPQQTFRLVDLSGSTNIKSLQSKQSIAVYPNPSNGTFHLNLSKPYARVKIANLSGKIVFETIAEGPGEISTNLEPGIYLLLVEADGNVATKKITIQ